MRFSKEQLDILVNKYLEQVKEEYMFEVQTLFFKRAKVKYAKYKTFTNEVLEELFIGSEFNLFMAENVDYVMNRYPEYWAEYIIKEIDQIIDFKELEIIELQEGWLTLINELEPIYIPSEKVSYFSKDYQNKSKKSLQVKYVKNKKKFLNVIGLVTMIPHTIFNMSEEVINTINKNVIFENELASSVLEKEVILGNKLENEIESQYLSFEEDSPIYNVLTL